MMLPHACYHIMSALSIDVLGLHGLRLRLVPQILRGAVRPLGVDPHRTAEHALLRGQAVERLHVLLGDGPAEHVEVCGDAFGLGGLWQHAGAALDAPADQDLQEGPCTACQHSCGNGLSTTPGASGNVDLQLLTCSAKCPSGSVPVPPWMG